MSNLPPAAVLAKRLEHELHTIMLLAPQEHIALQLKVTRAQQILTQLQEAMR